MPSPPKLLVVAAEPPISKPAGGGNERYLFELLALVRDLGWSLHYISDAEPGLAARHQQLDDLGVSNRTAPFCTDAPRGIELLDAAIDEIKPDVLHVNGHSGWLEETVIGCNRLGAVPRSVYTMHLPLATLELQAVQPFSVLQRLPVRWAGKQLARDRQFLQRFDDVLTVSEFYGDAAVRLGYMQAERLTFVPNAVDTDLFRPSSGLAADGKVRIGTACRLSQEKRLDLLIEAFAGLDDSAPAELHIAGKGPVGEELQALAKTLGVNDRVVFHGFLTDVAAFLGQLDVFAITSDEEAAPYSQLEAMACGLPSVVTAVGDLPFIVRAGVDGFVAPLGDAKQIGAALGKLVADPDLRKRMGQAARTRAVENFSSEVWRNRMTEFLTP